MNAKEILVEVREKSGKTFRILADGSTEGFEDRSIVINYAIALINHAKGIAKKNNRTI